ncbi:ABC transporter ATP-binding protein [Arthrobacter sp. zg-Y820]|uniref:ABC transporter ATP-binding protein n=1 Tax=unclassified Arthrobacter TaxID=235627 RepID=UPI001E5FDC06|nr:MULTISPECIES: ABC transporter ATP-binding protein [unclassified Arthrobacter]MCC9197011.1 ABC transporter ATP-binding protein [Arthrobacter sp. zg-Y820]MDK1279876.1 ABC transporter ATP-binding protein [Arthrobacter sp. zg.Y820]WIB09181.1 ABC transporter ATP-binding protein [Arthrobacter sp. zg-Y820]
MSFHPGLTPQRANADDGPAPVLAAARSVTKRYAGKPALSGVSLEIRAGEALGLLGPNGAGKSTLLSLLCGLRTADAGSVELFGRSPRDPLARRELGTTPQATSLPPTLRVRETVDFVAAHYADPVPTAELLTDFGLAEIAAKQCGGLSGGQQRRLMVALALVGRPRLVILDEPTTGLDVEARENLWERLGEYRRAGGTLLVTSHYLEEIQALSGRVVVLNSGAIVADGTVDEIRGHVSVSKVSFRTGLPPSSFASLPESAGATAGPNNTVTVLSRDADETVRRLVRDNVPFSRLEVHAASLEEAFLALTHHPDTVSASAGEEQP